MSRILQVSERISNKGNAKSLGNADALTNFFASHVLLQAHHVMAGLLKNEADGEQEKQNNDRGGNRKSEMCVAVLVVLLYVTKAFRAMHCWSRNALIIALAVFKFTVV